MGPSSRNTTENVMEGLYKMERRESVQLQTVLSMFNQEFDRDRLMPSYRRVKTMVRRQNDQMIRTRKRKARKERIEKVFLVKSQKGRKVCVEWKVGECCQWKATAQCSRGDSDSFSHGSNRGKEAQSSSPAPIARIQTDGRKPSTGFGLRGESPSRLKGLKAYKNYIKGKCADPSCDYWHPPVCQNYKSVSGSKFGDKCLFRHTVADGQHSKKSKKSCGKGSVALLKESKLLECGSQDCPQKVYSLRSWKNGIESRHHILQGHVAPHQISGEKRSIARSHAKVRTSRAQSVCAKIWRKNSWWNLATRKMRPQKHRIRRKMSTSSKNEGKAAFYSPTEGWVMPAPSSKKPEEREFAVDSNNSDCSQ